MAQDTSITNPYVGPRSFGYEERERFFGREREARDLLGRVLSERLLLFYAQSGAGKSSLLHTRLIPQLREEKGFVVLPVARVSGELPAGVEQVDNIHVFNLMLSIDKGGDPARLAHVALNDFLARLASKTVVDDAGQTQKGWVYDATLAAAPAGPNARRYALIVDQFEEIITSHPDRWHAREDFFRQLDHAMRDDPNLWVVLALREDYVASLDPYAPIMTDRLRARFYMERMGVEAALEAIRKPAELGGRPFAPGVAETLVDDLRQVRVAGQVGTVAGQHVEPVQLQVVCFQLWERLVSDHDAITLDDLAAAGDVNQALEYFYTDTLAAVLADPAVQTAGVSERNLRTWFDKELLTATGLRSTVYRDEAAGHTGALANAAIDDLVRRFLLRTELRGGGAWVELVHDRFVDPIRSSNAAWFPEHLSTLQRQAALWDNQGRSSGLLLREAALAEAEAWAADHTGEVESYEEEFLDACREAQAAIKRERRQSQRIRVLAVVAVVISVFAIGLALMAGYQTWQAGLAKQEAALQKDVAEAKATEAVNAQATALAEATEAAHARGTAVANAAVADAMATEAAIAEASVEANYKKALQELQVQQLQSSALEKKAKGDAAGAVADFQAAAAASLATGKPLDVSAEISDTRRYVATRLVLEGEALLRKANTTDAFGNPIIASPTASPLQRQVQQQAIISATALFSQALALNPPPDTLVYAYVPPGLFTVGSDNSDPLARSSEMPTNTVPVDGFWIMRTEVTNEQYRRCVDAGECEKPDNLSWDKPRSAKLPVTNVNWDQASTYAAWVGGRLPTEAEWEKACRGADRRIYPWGDENPSTERLNYNDEMGGIVEVGSYPSGANGIYDMAGNVYEWTSSLYDDFPYPYRAEDGREDPAASGNRTLRGGSFSSLGDHVRCAYRSFPGASSGDGFRGFRVMSPGFGR